MRVLLFKRSKPRKHKRRSDQAPAADAAPTAVRRPQDFLDGDMDKRPGSHAPRHRGQFAPLAGETIPGRTYANPNPTRVMRAVPSEPDATALMPAVEAPPSAANVRVNFRDAQSRVVATLSDPTWPMRPATADTVNGPWFRESDTVARDRSLAAFHEVWMRRRMEPVLVPRPTEQSMVMGAVGRGPAEGVSR